MKGRLKRILTGMLAGIMVFTTAIPSQQTTVEGKVTPTEAFVFQESDVYAVVTPEKAALTIAEKGWTNPLQLQKGIYSDGIDKVKGAGAFSIVTQEDQTGLEADQVRVKIYNRYYDPADSSIGMIAEAGRDYPWADAGADRNDNAEFAITKTGDDTGIISSVRGESTKWLCADETNPEKTALTDQKEKALTFRFVKTKGILNTDITIEHKKTGKLVKAAPTAGDGIAKVMLGAKGEEGTVFSNAIFGMSSTSTESGENYKTVSFVSKDYRNGIASARWVDGPYTDYLYMSNVATGNGWESVRVIPNEDGTVSFKDAYYDQFVTVDEEGALACGYKEELTDNEKFILHTEIVPEAVTDLSIDSSKRGMTTLDLSWKNPDSLYTSMDLYQKEEGGMYQKIATLTDQESYQVAGLTAGTKYYFKIAVRLAGVSGSTECEEVSATTRVGVKPATPIGLRLQQEADTFRLTWEAAENAESYRVLRAPSRFGTYEEVKASDVSFKDGTASSTEAVVTPEDEDLYSNYYRIEAVNGEEVSEQSDFASLEKEMFGDHTLIFAETDDVKKIDETLQTLFDLQNDYDNDAQFKGEQWQVYFKPGDYTETSCMYLGFYTSFNGLGKTPYDVKINNIAIPAYLPSGALGGDGNNATCNFWRSAENLSVINTGNGQGKAGYGSYRPDQLNWAVAQAAPLRRIYSTRPIAYDWNYGWASGGYVADCFIDASFYDNIQGQSLSAGTWSGQQFFTRNSKMSGAAYGTTLNDFFMGVEADNLLNDLTGTKLKGTNGYTNWSIPAKDGGQQVVTEITMTPKISEKPFLYLDDGEYKVFVPDVKENTKGISWGAGKENNGMGAGKSLSIDEFYIAKPTDNAATINKQIAAGKNIYFTPGTYHAEEPIYVNRENTILLGSGMASIIPDNDDTAIRVADVDGVRLEALIIDAGLSSRYLLQVGEQGRHTNHSSNPIVLQDLFFRVGGTTDVLTKAEDALEINSDDVIGDHFWIWRADHGAGVEWYGNESRHGIIVNGDNVNCYALFDEHFQEYDVLWNGENGATYFLQNEKCYDPISQDAWMSHNGTVNGYAAYKVSNDVKKHYAVGLGVYNVFIYTGPSYDASGVGIQMDNAIEVPNTDGVLVENACIQTFANDNDVIQRFNHIINGVGAGVSSGHNSQTGEEGSGWSRKYLLWYQNGKAAVGKADDTSKDKDGNYTGKGQNLGAEELTEVDEPADEELYTVRIRELAARAKEIKKEDYTEKSYQNSGLDDAVANADKIIRRADATDESSLSQGKKAEFQSEINAAGKKLEAALEKLIRVSDAKKVLETYRGVVADSTANGRKAVEDARNALEEAISRAEEADLTVKKDIYAIQLGMDNGCTRIQAAAELAETLKKVSEKLAENPKPYTTEGSKIVQSAFDQADATAAKATKAADLTQANENLVQAEKLAELLGQLNAGTLDESRMTEEGAMAYRYALNNLKKILSGTSYNEEQLKAAVDRVHAAEELAEELKKAEDCDGNDYTSESYQSYKEAAEKAKAVAKIENATAENLVSAADPLKTTLILKAKKELSDAVREMNAKDLKAADYTNKSWHDYKNIISQAQNVAEDANATAAKCKDALETLKDAPLVLVLKSGSEKEQVFAALQSALIQAENAGYKESDYTAESWKAYRKVLDDAAALKENSSLDELKTAIQEVKKAPDKLVKKGQDSGIKNPDVTDTKPDNGKNDPENDRNKPDTGKENTGKDGSTVSENGAKNLTVNTKKVCVVKGQSRRLKVKLTPEGSTDIVSYESNKPSVVTVKNGKLKAKKTGSVIITVKTRSGETVAVKVTVVKKAKKAKAIHLNKKKVTIKTGEWMLLSASLNPEKSTDTVKWKSSNKKVATVDAYGFVTAKKKGKVKITAVTKSGKKATCTITVK